MPLKLSKNLVKLRHSRSRMVLSEGPFTGTHVKLVLPRPPDSAGELYHEVVLSLKTICLTLSPFLLSLKPDGRKQWSVDVG